MVEHGPQPESTETVEPLSDLDPLTGELPCELHHVATRGAHPELKHTMANLLGLGHDSHHTQIHGRGEAIPERPTFFSMF